MEYKDKIVEQLVYHIKEYDKAILNGSYKLVHYSLKNIVKLAEDLYELYPAHRVVKRISKEAGKLKKTKNTALLTELIGKL